MSFSTLLVGKNHLPLQFEKSAWLKCLMLQLCLQVQFPSQKLGAHNVLHYLVEKTQQTYVWPLLDEGYCVIINFDP